VKRREFITLLGSSTVVWPLAARAQQPQRTRRIGVFMPGMADDPEGQARNAGFLQRLGELGWIVGRNVRIDYRWGGGDLEHYHVIAAELIALSPDVILALGYSIVSALQKATRSVPIVFASVTDPVGGGLVASLARAGRQYHRICHLRIRLCRKVAGAAQRDRPARVARSGSA